MKVIIKWLSIILFDNNQPGTEIKHKKTTTISNLGPFIMFALWVVLLKFWIGKFEMGKVAVFILCFFHAIKINAMLEIIKQKVRGTKTHL